MQALSQLLQEQQALQVAIGRELQEKRMQLNLQTAESSQSVSPTDGLPQVDPCHEQDMAVQGTLTRITQRDAQIQQLQQAQIDDANLLQEQLQILQQCRLNHPEWPPM